MTKAEMIKVMREAEGGQSSKAGMERAYEALFTAIGDSMKAGEKVAIRGFGTFEMTDAKEREGRNPQTGEKMIIPAKKRAKFTAAQALKDTLNA